MNSILEDIITSGTVKSVNGELEKLHSNISFSQGKFLQGIISGLNPINSLEVGLAFGVSALFICDALSKNPDARHHIIDPHQLTGWKGIGINNLKKAGYEDVIKFYEQPSYLALPNLDAQGLKIDFAFIDGMHTFDYTLLDFFYIDRMLKVGGVVVIDDTDFSSVRKVCRYIITNRAYSVFRCLSQPQTTFSIEEQLLQFQAYISESDREIMKPEFIQPDSELGLVPGTRCIAFKKESEDTREWNFHQEF